MLIQLFIYVIFLSLLSNEASSTFLFAPSWFSTRNCRNPPSNTKFGPRNDQRVFSATAAGDTDYVWDILVRYKDRREVEFKELLEKTPNATFQDFVLLQERGELERTSSGSAYYDPKEDNPLRLCLLHLATFALDDVMTKLLVFAGFSPNMTDGDRRTPLHYIVDPLATYHLWWVRNLLKGKRVWLNDYTDDTDPPRASLDDLRASQEEASSDEGMVPLPQHLVPNFDPYEYNVPPKTAYFSSKVSAGQIEYYNEVLNSALEPQINKVVDVLLAGGADPNRRDLRGLTVLHQAANGGLLSVVKKLLAYGANVHIQDKEGRTALHHATLTGYADVVEVLLQHGADPKVKDRYNNSVEDCARGAGAALSPAETLKLFGFEQEKPIRHTNRRPEDLVLQPGEGFGHHGGWDPSLIETETFPIDLNSLHCDFDRITIEEATPELVENKYLRRDRPVVIEGMMRSDWLGWSNYSHDNLLTYSPETIVTVHGIPYVEGYSAMKGKKMPLGEYIKQMDANELGYPPKYVFHQSDVSFVGLPDVSQVPSWLGNIAIGNKQFGIGTKGSGAQLHWHVVAWNALFYGRKLWFVVPPRYTAMTGKRALDWYREDFPNYAPEQKPSLCIQHQGDVIFIPEMWGHAILNVQASVALATEFNDLQRPPWDIPSSTYSKRINENHNKEREYHNDDKVNYSD